MKRTFCSNVANWRWLAVLLAAATLTGCERTKPPLFRLNFEGVDNYDSAEPGKPRELTITPEIETALVDVLDGFFGQPNKPYVPPEAETGLDLAKIALASGPSLTNSLVVVQKYAKDKDATAEVRVVAGTKLRDDAESLTIHDFDLGETTIKKADVIGTHKQAGLYRQHCAHCHDVTGGGDGPTAELLDPYPRDFRKGVFKFTSGKAFAKPTRADLMRTLDEGIPGTAMPSFRLLPKEEREALVEYVIYLAMRGENETSFRDKLVEDPKVFDPQEGDAPSAVFDFIMEEGIFDVSAWDRAEKTPAVEPPPRPDMPLEQSIALGKAMYLDKRLLCVGCHGATGLGDGTVNIDVWNKEKEKHPELFSLPLQDLPPRNLRLGVYRGGRRPVDLYRRIYGGINGSNMPEFATAFKGREEQIWHLVDYVRSMPFETTDGPATVPPPPGVEAAAPAPAAPATAAPDAE